MHLNLYGLCFGDKSQLANTQGFKKLPENYSFPFNY